MIITLTGPTCAGKSTIERELQALGCGRAISHTTRLPRPGEKHGVHYFFVDDECYDRMNAAGEFIETITFGSKRYAMSKLAIRAAQAENDHAAIVVDPYGAEQIRHFCQQEGIPAYSVWVDCGAEQQAQRWLTRVMQDFVLEAAAERLALMLAEETVWRADASRGKIQADGRYRYHQKILSTDRLPAIVYAQDVMASIDSMLNDGSYRAPAPGTLHPMAFLNRPDLH